MNLLKFVQSRVLDPLKRRWLKTEIVQEQVATPTPLPTVNSRKDRALEAKIPIYRRGAELIPPDYLIVHQASEPDRARKIREQAAQRNARRNAKRLANA